MAGTTKLTNRVDSNYPKLKKSHRCVGGFSNEMASHKYRRITLTQPLIIHHLEVSLSSSLKMRMTRLFFDYPPHYITVEKISVGS